MTGEQLRSLRRRLGLTQAELADELGVHANTVARWERDEVSIREPVVRLLKLMAKSLPGESGKPGGR